MKIKVKKLEHAYALPEYSTQGSSGMDLYAAMNEPVLLKPLNRTLVPTGISLEIPVGYEAQIRPRSGLANKYGITVLNTPGTIDADYRGEIQVILVNLGENDFIIEPGMRIAQIVFSQVEHVVFETTPALTSTAREAGGFGSTGY